MSPEESQQPQERSIGEALPRHELRTRYLDACKGMSEEASLEQFDREITLAEAIQREFPNYIQYQMYHWLIGSSPTRATSPISDDFPGEYSVTKFFQEFIDTHS